ncbi:unnamed protein product [Macrosiphum euphorbiae]|uniref:Uncharacterized protein n=1 Tax=Macrosiphum euphorbiae TaxID=13131 RepID=A0AAV0WBW8_9HEMI|nr:unnamed protein product [Macrosiphum euphorbiae]
MSSFYSSSQRLQSNVCSYRYPSYLMKVSPPQVGPNFDPNNMLLLPKICNKYYVRKNNNSVMDNNHYVDDLSVKSTVELNDTTSMKLTGNEFKMMKKATDDYGGFESCSNHSFGSFKKSTHSNFRYPSYLMKVSPPQVCSNFDLNNMLLLPKICNKYSVRKNSNSVTNKTYCIDDLAAKSTVELNNTTSMKLTGNEFKIMNKEIDNYTGLDSGSHNSFENVQQSASHSFTYPSYPMKVSTHQVCSNLENMLMQNNKKKNGTKKSSSTMMKNSHNYFDRVCVKSSSVDVKSSNLNDNKIKTTNTPKDINQKNNCLTLTKNDLKTEGVMKMENSRNLCKIFTDFDNQVPFPTKVDEVKLFKICGKCHKGCSVDNFDWEKISNTDRIKLLEIIKQNSKNQVSYSILRNLSNNNSNQNLSISKTICPDKTQDSISI